MASVLLSIALFLSYSAGTLFVDKGYLTLAWITTGFIVGISVRISFLIQHRHDRLRDQTALDNGT